MGKRNKILALVLCAMLVTVMVFGIVGSGAWFTDQEKVTNNSLTAGKIDLELGTGSTPISVTDIKPGDSGSKTITLTSVEGNLPANLDITIANLVQAENGLVEPETAAGDYENGGDLWIFLQWSGYVDVNQNGTFDTGDIQLAYGGQKSAYPGFWGGDFHLSNITSFGSNAWTDLMTMAEGQSVDVVINWSFPTESPDGNYSENIAMTDSLAFDLVFDLAQ